ncbi:hypothetical protein ACQKBZ_12910 [Mycobacterium tuberculosis]
MSRLNATPSSMSITAMLRTTWVRCSAVTSARMALESVSFVGCRTP